MNEGTLSSARMSALLRDEWFLLISIISSVAFLVWGDVLLNGLANPAWLTFLFLWLFAVILTSALSRVRHADHLIAYMIPAVYLAEQLARPVDYLVETLQVPVALGGIIMAILKPLPRLRKSYPHSWQSGRALTSKSAGSSHFRYLNSCAFLAVAPIMEGLADRDEGRQALSSGKIISWTLARCRGAAWRSELTVNGNALSNVRIMGSCGFRLGTAIGGLRAEPPE